MSNLLEVQNLSVKFPTRNGVVEAVRNISFSLGQERLGIVGESGSGKICLNGPAARMGLVGDQVIVLSYGLMDPEEARSYKAKIIHLDENNKIKK
ncbi:MAG: aspartate 1-decarboxylase [Desulfocapsa sp.]|nr:aspartate 1-decarboxylase [Desulfocapsa sp.]